MSAESGTPPGGEYSEEELRAAYEAELARVRVEDVLVQTVVSLLNLGARKAGLTGAPEEPDFDQVSQAIDATRALLPFIEAELGEDAKQVRDALSQLQMTFARSGATAPAGSPPPEQPEAPKPGGPGPAQKSGRLWVPGQ